MWVVISSSFTHQQTDRRQVWQNNFILFYCCFYYLMKMKNCLSEMLMILLCLRILHYHVECPSAITIFPLINFPLIIIFFSHSFGPTQEVGWCLPESYKARLVIKYWSLSCLWGWHETYCLWGTLQKRRQWGRVLAYCSSSVLEF